MQAIKAANSKVLVQSNRLSNKDYFIHVREEHQNKYEGSKQRMQAVNLALSDLQDDTQIESLKPF